MIYTSIKLLYIFKVHTGKKKTGGVKIKHSHLKNSIFIYLICPEGYSRNLTTVMDGVSGTEVGGRLNFDIMCNHLLFKAK